MSEVNIPLLRKAVEWAEAEAAKPEIDREWYQGAFTLDPAEYAWALLDDLPEFCGVGPVMRMEARQDAGGRSAAPCGTPTASPDTSAEVAGLHTNTYAHDAADLLGIKYNGYGKEAGGHLFHTDNSIEDVRRIAEDIAGERL